MKKYIRITATVLTSLLLMLFWACTKDFENINKDPNNPGLELAAPDMLLTNSIESLTDRVHEIFLGHEMGNCWVQHMAKVQYTDEDRYIPRIAVINNSWNSFYAASGKDVQTIYDVAVLRGHDNYKGVAIVLKCYISSVLTDLFGPVPYFSAWKGDLGSEYTLPAYDSQEAIYTDMLAQLDTANMLLDPDGSEIGGDILYGNDILKWKKFANSLRLRLLLRVSDRMGTYATTEMTKIVNAPGTYPIFESVADDAALQYLGSAPNNNPINENRKTRDDHRVSKTTIDMLNNVYFDYRVMAYALPDGNNLFEGLPNGLTSAKAAAYNGGGLKNTSKIGDFFTAATSPGMLMSFSELNFILAEAAVRNFIPGGMNKAAEYYNAGILASFEQYRGILTEIFTDHSGGSYGGMSIPAGYTVDDEAGWHVSDSTAPAFFAATLLSQTDAIKLIADQKFLAMFDQGLQSWFEWRRIDYPVLPPAEDGLLSGKMPVRVYYPSDEGSRNPTNLAAAIATLGGPDDLLTKVWWDTK